MQDPTHPATRVLVMHDTPLLASGVVAALSGQRDLAVALAPPCLDPTDHPAACDVLVADHAVGIAVAERLRQRPRPGRVQVLILTTTHRERDVRIALERGVRGYLLADCSTEELVAGVRRVAQGVRFICAAAAQRMADSLAQEALTAREIDVLCLLARGRPNKLIASELGLAIGTVKAHVKSILNKLGARGRTEAVSVANQRGLVDEPVVRWPRGPAEPPAAERPGPALGRASGP